MLSLQQHLHQPTSFHYLQRPDWVVITSAPAPERIVSAPAKAEALIVSMPAPPVTVKPEVIGLGAKRHAVSTISSGQLLDVRNRSEQHHNRCCSAQRDRISVSTTINRVSGGELSTNCGDAISASTSINRQSVITRLGGDHISTTSTRDLKTANAEAALIVSTPATSNSQQARIIGLRTKRHAVGAISSCEFLDSRNVVEIGISWLPNLQSTQSSQC